MHEPLDLAVVILCFNEEKHLKRCIESVRELARQVFVIDGFSIDDSTNIARQLGATVLQHRWINYSTQFNWALDNAPIASKWIMRLDADEVVTPDLAKSLKKALGAPAHGNELPNGYTVNRRVYFLGRWIRHGGIYPAPMLRIWRTGLGRCETRWMDEHMVVGGPIAHLEGDICDINLNDISWWTHKHVSYASREAIDSLVGNTGTADGLSLHARKRRWLKNKIYLRAPLGVRALGYFLYRYVLRLGFLDGWQGFTFHLLQGLWYRLLVDLKIHEIREVARVRQIPLVEAISVVTGHSINAKDQASL